ncbi:hypothetical protein [Streptomyces murinus]|uniref:hypothetical protein n=1 Tax=Streptomyces murinus TaxID=33900 RepID=UPI0021158522|nr:hypothetical protein [Streptomyces murinus]
MGIGMRRAAITSSTALLLCFAAVGTATADQQPPIPGASDSEQAAATDSISADATTDINDRTGWDDDEATAVVQPQYCAGPQTWIDITSKTNYHIASWWNGTKYKDGPGGSMTASVTKSGTISAEVSGSTEVSASSVVVAAKASVSAKIGGSVSITTGHTYTHNIAKNKYGHLQYGSWGYKVSWAKYRRKGDGCHGATLVDSGTATLPTSETGWKYWETTS